MFGNVLMLEQKGQATPFLSSYFKGSLDVSQPSFRSRLRLRVLEKWEGEEKEDKY